MKRFIVFLIICLSLIFVEVMAQDESVQEEGAEPAEVKESVQKPQRPLSSVSRPKIPKGDYESMEVLAKGLNLPEDALVWLDSYTAKYLALWQRDRSGFPKGALLIVHAEGETPISPEVIKPLHDTLPDYGWATLAISLPHPDGPGIPKRTIPVKAKPKLASEAVVDEAVQGGEAPSAEPVKPMVVEEANLNQQSTEEETIGRLEGALKFLHDQGQFNVIVLGSGTGAIRAQTFLDRITPKIDNPRLRETLEKPIRAMVIVNGRNNLPSTTSAYKGWFADPEIPVLDIFMQTDNRNLIEAKHRKVLARQKQVAIYKQVRIVKMSGENSWGENRVSRRVRSFLDNNAVGVEVKNAKLRRYK